MSSSCSFRITRTAEDLAQTVAALSQRLVQLEKRQKALEVKFDNRDKEVSDEDIQRLEGVDQLLQDCKELLDSSSQNQQENTVSELESDDQQSLAA